MPKLSSLKDSIISHAEKLKFAGLSVFLGSVLLGTARRAYAAGKYLVTTNADSGAGSLRAEVAAANAAGGGTVTFQAGLTSPINLTTGPIVISTNVTITGPGAANLTISGRSNYYYNYNNGTSYYYGIFYTGGAGNNISISGLTLTQGKAKYGGAIHSVNDNLTLSNCAITGNATTYSYGGSGGAINQFSGSLTIQNCTIYNNKSFGGYNNRGGGGILQYTGTISIQNTKISGNYAYSSGGGVDLQGTTTATILNSTITGNYSKARGGGIYCNSGSLTLDGTTVSKNTSYNKGGGVYLYNVSTAIQNSSVISGNSAYGKNGKGGGIAQRYGTVSIQNSTIQNNYSARHGGGAYLYGTTTTIVGSTISPNRANVNGGGIYQKYGTVTITNSTISNNQSKYGTGGGLFLYGAISTIQNSTVSNNTCPYGGGGGIYEKNAALTIQYCTISSNTSHYGGGGISAHRAGIKKILNSTISGNTGKYGGGAWIYRAPAGSLIQNCTITANTSATPYKGGGGVFLYSGNLAIQNSTISNNMAPKGVGGGIYAKTAGKYVTTLNLVSTIVSGNTDTTGANEVNRLAVPQVTINATYDLFQAAPIAGTINGTNTANITGVNPLLGALANNGGPTQTMALLAGSPAIDKGSNPAALTTDQRGTGFARVIGTAIDIGAFERDTVAPTAALTAGNITTPVTTYTFTVTFADNVAVDVTTLGNSNILVTGPNSFSQLATFVSAAPSVNRPSIVATYSITSPIPFPNGTYTFAMQANQVKDTSGNPVVAGTLGTIAATGALAFASAPSAAPNPVLAGQVVQFSASVTGSGPFSYAWNFGDGATGTGSPVGHAFAAPGTYVATLTVTDAYGSTITATVTVTVLDPNGDADGDGFTNDVEVALGSNPLSALSSPFNLPKPTATAALSPKHLKIQLIYGAPNSDSMVMTGKLPVPSGFKPAGQYVIFNIGHVIKAFQLNAKGVAINSTGATGLLNDAFKLSRGNFALKLAGGAFQSALNSETDPARDLNSTQGSSPTRKVKVTIYFNNTVFSGDVIGKFSAPKGLFKK